MCGLLDKALPVIGAVAGFAVGGPAGAAIGSGLGGAAGNYAQTHDFGSALEAGALSGATTYAGGQLFGGATPAGGATTTGGLGGSEIGNAATGTAASSDFGSTFNVGAGGAPGALEGGTASDLTGGGLGSQFSIGNGGYGSVIGTTGGETRPTGDTGTFGGMDTGLGSGFNGLGLNNGVSAGDISGFGTLSPSSGGIPIGTFSGGIGDSAGDGLGNTLGSGFSGTGVNSAIDAGTAASAQQSGLSRLFDQAKGLYGQAKDLYNGPLGQTYRVGSALYDAYAANQKAKAAQGLQGDILANYAPNSLYAQAMERELAAKDAAAGRNSQYGARSLMLAQNLAQARANAMQGPAYQGLQSTAQGNRYGGLTSLSKLFGMNNPNLGGTSAT